MEKTKSKKNTFLIVLKWIVYVLIILLIVISLWLMIDRISGYNFSFFGLRSSVISSDSMSEVNVRHEYKDYLLDNEERLYKNDLIFTYDAKSIEDLEVFDIVTYLNSDNTLICHRIVQIDVDANKIWTQGDANNARDGVIEFEDIKGVYIGKISGIGAASLYLQSPYGLFGISIAFLFIFGAAIILEIDKNKKEAQKENVNDIEENNETQEDASINNNEEQSSVPSDNNKEVNNNEK
ncbi:MAG: S24/S26 family peptidase [Firmicutes bacterium]|nr:S24/S26 family peptidase [Candidatus Alectryobacillus merdavium]